VTVAPREQQSGLKARGARTSLIAQWPQASNHATNAPSSPRQGGSASLLPRKGLAYSILFHSPLHNTHTHWQHQHFKIP
jgi:hypothetical protein